jgi:hypothetical protein
VLSGDHVGTVLLDSPAATRTVSLPALSASRTSIQVIPSMKSVSWAAMAAARSIGASERVVGPARPRTGLRRQNSPGRATLSIFCMGRSGGVVPAPSMRPRDGIS